MTRPCRKHRSGPASAPTAVKSTAATEPVMRRWPHPVEPPAPPPGDDLRTLLQRQTELLLEIRTLLIRLTAEQNLKP